MLGAREYRHRGAGVPDTRVTIAGADKHQRFSYATSMENLEKGTDRIAKALAKLE